MEHVTNGRVIGSIAFLLWALFFVFLWSIIFSGCIPGLNSQNVQHLTPEQIKALGDSAQSFSSCTTIGGPPLGGRSTLLFYPANNELDVRFGPDCQILATPFIVNPEINRPLNANGRPEPLTGKPSIGP